LVRQEDWLLIYWVLQAPVAWEVMVLVCFKVIEVVVFGFEVMTDPFGVAAGFVVGGDSDMLLQSTPFPFPAIFPSFTQR